MTTKKMKACSSGKFWFVNICLSQRRNLDNDDYRGEDEAEEDDDLEMEDDRQNASSEGDGEDLIENMEE